MPNFVRAIKKSDQCVAIFFSDFIFPPRCKRDLCSSAILCSVAWQLVTAIFGNKLSFPSSRLEQSKKIAGSNVLCIYVGNGVGSDWFLENVKLARRVSGACQSRRGGKERKEVNFRSGCSEVKRPRNKRRPAGAGRKDVK